MPPADALRVAPGVLIPRREIRIEFTRSGGPGGQRVNKAETCAIVRFTPAESSVLSERQKELVAERLGSRLTLAGELILRCTEYASRERNEEAGLARLANLLGDALKPRKARRATRPTRGSRERRLSGKRHDQQKKRTRRSLDE
ncbi:MAG: aminoacyl-tRNA hydrolase [Planctomycetes bacterium]|nr:aminoacyl-tRNA hydrolase [Planctomycetota bacterium]